MGKFIFLKPVMHIYTAHKQLENFDEILQHNSV